MNIVNIPAGKYVIAVSGGVDSVVLLDLVARIPNCSFIVAHVDHGIRSDSRLDRQLVERLAKKYHLEFCYTEARLGATASEEMARKARYDFLYKVKEQSGARAIITAHHQDDLIETIILNLFRGTKRKGITSLDSNSDLLRPLLDSSKQDLYTYANQHNLVWREDPSNLDKKYSRNWIRHNVMPRLSVQQRRELLDRHQNLKSLNIMIDQLIDNLLEQNDQAKLSRRQFINLPHDVAKEVCATWLRKNNYADFDSKTIEKLTVNLKKLAPGKTIHIAGGDIVVAQKDFVFNSSQKNHSPV